MKHLITFVIIWFGILSGLSQTEKVVQPDSLNNIVLGEVTIKGHRQTMKLKHGVLTADVRRTDLASIGNGRDVLKHLPYIRYSEDGYKVADKGTPIIYIDGHLVNDNMEVERLSSRDIDRVEVITNPGAEYDATVKSVIRIYTIHKLEDFLSASLKSSLIQGRETAYTEQLDLGYRRKKLSLQGNVYFIRPKSSYSQNATYDIYIVDKLLVNSDTHFNVKGNVAGAKLAMNYDFSKNHAAGISYSSDYRPSIHYNTNSTYSALRSSLLEDEVNYLSNSQQNDVSRLINGFYQGEVGKWKIDFTTDIVLSRENFDQYSGEIDAKNDSSTINSFSKAHNNMYAAKLMLVHPLWKGQLKMGTDYTFIRRRERFDNPQAVLPSTNSLIHEKKIAGFAQWSVALGQLNATAGLRYEHAVTDYWEKGVLIPGQSKTYNDWLPNLSLDLPIGAVQTSLSYTAKKERPSFHDLRSNLNYNNRYIYEGGNPLLQPATNHVVDFNMAYGWLQLTAGYSYIKNAISFDGKSYEKNADVAIFSSKNFDHRQQFNAGVYLSPVIGRWKPIVGIEGYKQIFEIQNQGAAKSMDKPYFYFSLNNTFELPGKTILSLDANYQTKGNYSSISFLETGGIDLGIRKTMLKDCLDINLQLTDVFHTSNGNFLLYGDKLTYAKHLNPDSRQLLVTVTYRWHQNKADYKGKHVSSEDINRLK